MDYYTLNATHHASLSLSHSSHTRSSALLRNSGTDWITTDAGTPESWLQATTAPSIVETNETQSWSDETTMQSIIELETSSNTNESWEECTTEHVSADNNVTTITPSISTCPPAVTPEMLDAAKREIIDSITSAISRHIGDRLDALEARLSTLSCSSAPTSPPVRLAWQIYENLQVQLHGWLRVFDQPYSHRTRTRTDDLSQLSGICQNDVLVAASFNNSISLAAVGPASVLTLNKVWNRPQLVGQVYWYRTNGQSFGFSPLPAVRQTSGDKEDLTSPLRLSWILDQSAGGYRAGTTRALTDSSLWRKVIFCN